jgi:AraC-like DNA-binding protein
MDEHDRLLLDIATRLYLVEGSRDRAFREETGLSPIRGWQQVVALIQTEEALRVEPERVLRLRRLLEHRLQQRRAS